MKPTGQIELAFETGLIFCFGYGIGDGELQDSFRESLTLRLVVEVHYLLFLASQMQKEHSMDDLLKFVMLFLIRVLLKPSFLRQHKLIKAISPSTDFNCKKFHRPHIRFYSCF